MGSLYQRTRKMPDGTKFKMPTIWIKYRQNGRVIRESSGSTNPNVARRMLRVREGDVENGIPITPKMGRAKIDEGFDAVENDYKKNRRDTLIDLKIRIKKHLKPFFGGMLANAITTDVIDRYVVGRQEGEAANGTINRELAILRRAFTLLRKARKMMVSPAVDMLDEHNTRKGFFEREAFEAVRGHLPPSLRSFATFMYLTGWRKSEVLKLEWRSIEFKTGIMRSEPGETKNGEAREFPFDELPELAELLDAQRAAADALKKQNVIVCRVFFWEDGSPIKDIRGSWEAACKAAGQPGKLLHDFRRTAVRNLERAGVPRATAMALVGHKTESIYRRYAVKNQTDLRDGVKLLSALEEGTLSGTLAKKSRPPASKASA